MCVYTRRGTAAGAGWACRLNAVTDGTRRIKHESPGVQSTPWRQGKSKLDPTQDKNDSEYVFVSLLNTGKSITVCGGGEVEVASGEARPLAPWRKLVR